MRGRDRTGLALAGLLAASVGCASLSPPPSSPDPAIARCPPELSVRLRFLEERIEGEGRYARRWWMAWNGVHGGGIVVSGALAAIEHGRGERALRVVDATKAGIGLAHNLLQPLVAKDALREVQQVDVTAPGGCQRRVALAETLLARAAEQARRERHGWVSHLSNLALNVAGAWIVAEGFHEGGGWSAGALGIVTGEIEIWTFPWRSQKILDEYRRRYPPPEP